MSSSDIYQQAEELLLTELGLKDWKPTEKSVTIKSFSNSFLASRRLDAEYYQPKYDQLVNKLNEKVTLSRLGDLLTVCQRGKQPQYTEALPDNHVTILRTNALDPVYLSIYLNSIAGQLQVEKNLKGSSGQIELYPNDIMGFFVWEAPQNIKLKIRDKVEEAHYKREQSKKLLEIAKIGVEKAIESDEETATQWINKQLEELGVKLESSN